MPGPTGLLIGGVRVDVAVRVDATIVNLRKLDAQGQRECVEAVKRAGDQFKALVQERCARATGFMAEHVRVEYSEKGYTFEGGWNADDFESVGLPFYPPFPEFGTSRQPAQPSLLPSFDDVSRSLEADLTASIRANLARASV